MDDPYGIVFNIQRFSIEDGPGIRTTVFMKGCPLRCVWCHNPEGLLMKPELMWFESRCIGDRDCMEACPGGALELTPRGMRIDRDECEACGRCADVCPGGALEVVGRRYTVAEAFAEVERDTAYYGRSGGGVTVSGGEAALQPGFVGGLMRLCRDAGIHTALDTSGYASLDVLEGLLDVSDMVLLDLKTLDREKHEELTGVELARILDNARMISGTGKPMWIRTPVIPGRTDSEDNIRALAGFIARELPSVVRYDLLAFNNACAAKYARLGMRWEMEAERLMSREKMESLAAAATSEGAPNVAWSGATARKGS